ncbi:uncharacterized protein J3D65DRAFT_158832 [Phyllosticta citribraziliensis]|uniref:Uncharacterized protein n=1 Tax=Phyllosticta citribraziliensis TaxID=989973 RepID=A0ABR1L5V9_9PEZI
MRSTRRAWVRWTGVVALTRRRVWRRGAGRLRRTGVSLSFPFTCPPPFSISASLFNFFLLLLPSTFLFHISLLPPPSTSLLYFSPLLLSSSSLLFFSPLLLSSTPLFSFSLLLLPPP